MRIVITESQYNTLSERLDYSVGDLPAKGNTLSPRQDEFFGDEKDYNRKLRRSNISDDQMKINKVRSKLIAMYDNYVDKIRYETVHHSNEGSKFRIEKYEDNLNKIREVMKDEQTLLSLYDKFGSQEEYTPRKENDKPQDYESVKNYVDSSNKTEFDYKLNKNKQMLTDYLSKTKQELNQLQDLISRQERRFESLLQMNPGSLESFGNSEEKEKQKIKDLKTQYKFLKDKYKSINQHIKSLTNQQSNPT
jgi:hypothetical protein